MFNPKTQQLTEKSLHANFTEVQQVYFEKLMSELEVISGGLGFAELKKKAEGGSKEALQVMRDYITKKEQIVELIETKKIEMDIDIEKEAFAEYMEEVVTDPENARFNMDVEIPDKLRSGEKIWGEYHVDELLTKFAHQQRGLTFEQAGELRDSLLRRIYVEKALVPGYLKISYVGYTGFETAVVKAVMKKAKKFFNKIMLDLLPKYGFDKKDGYQTWEIVGEMSEGILKETMIPEIEKLIPIEEARLREAGFDKFSEDEWRNWIEKRSM
ncbi:hypothetical protein HOM83_00800 [Candidatus Falkowbacteria bacterium]|nr:hypothetical protein [Candidatus Falkowbacteria bacterium]